MLTIADLFPVPVDLELKHPVSGESLGVMLKVVGPDSTEFRDARNAFIKKFPVDGAKTPDAVELQKENDAILASMIVGWSNDEFFGNPFSKDVALGLMTNPGLNWLKQQIGEFTDKRSNFFRTGGAAA